MVIGTWSGQIISYLWEARLNKVIGAWSGQIISYLWEARLNKVIGAWWGQIIIYLSMGSQAKHGHRHLVDCDGRGSMIEWYWYEVKIIIY